MLKWSLPRQKFRNQLFIQFFNKPLVSVQVIRNDKTLCLLLPESFDQ